MIGISKGIIVKAGLIMSGKLINNIDELQISIRHKNFISVLLENIKSDNRVSKIILFGSCAKGNANDRSDIDILITTHEDIGEEQELEFYDYLPPYNENYVPCDLLIMPEKRYEENKKKPFYVQKYINKHGVELSGLLQ